MEAPLMVIICHLKESIVALVWDSCGSRQSSASSSMALVVVC
jgi:hypothetical protein